MRTRATDSTIPLRIRGHTQYLSIMFFAASLIATLPSASTSPTYCYDITGKQEVVASACGAPPLVVYTITGATETDHFHAGVM
jgi:hypothetical protein